MEGLGAKIKMTRQWSRGKSAIGHWPQPARPFFQLLAPRAERTAAVMEIYLHATRFHSDAIEHDNPRARRNSDDGREHEALSRRICRGGRQCLAADRERIGVRSDQDQADHAGRAVRAGAAARTFSTERVLRRTRLANGSAFRSWSREPSPAPARRFGAIHRGEIRPRRPNPLLTNRGAGSPIHICCRIAAYESDKAMMQRLMLVKGVNVMVVTPRLPVRYPSAELGKSRLCQSQSGQVHFSSRRRRKLATLSGNYQDGGGIGQ